VNLKTISSKVFGKLECIYLDDSFDSIIFEGEFKNLRQNGYGKETNIKTKEVKQGFWEEGTFKKNITNN
jgi:hypothetical protein